MLLEVGMTVLDNVPDYRLTRDALSLETPDGKTIPLPPVTEQRGNTQAIEQRAKVQRDSINYFPPKASRACALLFFRSRVCRPSLFQDPRWYHVWPALAQREVPEQPRARAFSDPD